MQNTAEIVRRRITRSNGTLSESERRAVRTACTFERRNSTTSQLAERFHRNVTLRGRSLSERAQLRQMGDFGDEAMTSLAESWQRDEFHVNGKDGVDFEDLTRRLAGRSRGRALEQALSHTRSGRRLTEDVTNAIMVSQYSKFIDSLIRMGTYEMAQAPSVAPILSLLGRIQVDCSQTTLASDPVLVDLEKEIRPRAEGEQTPFLGLRDPSTISIHPRDKYKFAYVITRETMCQGIDVKLREIMSQGAMLLDEHHAPEAIQLLFGIYANPADNRWPFVLNGTRWRSYYQPQATEGEVPYENLIFQTQDISSTNYGLFVAIENLYEDMTNFVTGKPIAMESLNIVGTGKQQSQHIREALGAVTIARTTGGVGNEVVEFDRTGRDGWNAQAFTSVWIRRYLHEIHSVVNPTWTKAQRDQAIQRTLFAGASQDFASMLIEWDRETSPMPMDEAAFHQEMLWGIKFLEKTGYAITNPQSGVCVHGLPDGEAVPALDPTPIA